MRAFLAVVLVMALTSFAVAAPKKKKKEQPDPNPAIDKIAREVFKQNDRNHNDALSRTELHTAQKDAQTRLWQLARQGVLGAAKSKDVEVGAASADMASLEKSNKVSQKEFTAHVHSMAQQVDVAARQQYQASAEQKKKLAAAKKAAAKKRANNNRKKG
jgi:hypothetical protein